MRQNQRGEKSYLISEKGGERAVRRTRGVTWGGNPTQAESFDAAFRRRPAPRVPGFAPSRPPRPRARRPVFPRARRRPPREIWPRPRAVRPARARRPVSPRAPPPRPPRGPVCARRGLGAPPRRFCAPARLRHPTACLHAPPVCRRGCASRAARPGLRPGSAPAPPTPAARSPPTARCPAPRAPPAVPASSPKGGSNLCERFPGDRRALSREFSRNCRSGVSPQKHKKRARVGTLCQ